MVKFSSKKYLLIFKAKERCTKKRLSFKPTHTILVSKGRHQKRPGDLVASFKESKKNFLTTNAGKHIQQQHKQTFGVHSDK